jgi:PIN domain nuclease of toxin-antitoxin system
MEPRERNEEEQEGEVSGFLLDTHYWLWLQMGNAQRLDGKGRRELLEMQKRGALYLSAVSVWEVARLVADHYVDLSAPVDQFVDEALRDGGLQLIPLSTRVLIESTRLPGDLHRDPSDRLLAATAREHSLTLVTRDKELLRYGRRGHLQAVNV